MIPGAGERSVEALQDRALFVFAAVLGIDDELAGRRDGGGVVQLRDVEPFLPSQGD